MKPHNFCYIQPYSSKDATSPEKEEDIFDLLGGYEEDEDEEALMA